MRKDSMNFFSKLLLLLLKLVMILYDIITIPLYFIFQQPWRRWMEDRIIWAKQLKADDPYSSCVRIARSCMNPLEGINTMDELFRMAVVRHDVKKCLGVREIEAEVDEYQKNGKLLKKYRLGEYQWFSYVDINQRIENLTKALLEIGLTPKKQIAIFAETRIEWMLICQACFRINVPVATLYATLGEDGVIHGLNETEVSHVFTSQDLLPKLKKIVTKCPLISNIVYMENIRPAESSGFSDNVSLLPFSQLEKLGANCDAVSKSPPEPDDLAVIMYTSGSTGMPKGVMLTHRNMVATASGFLDCDAKLKESDVYIGYLPLAHCLEISAECLFFVLGIPVGYSTPYTITDKSTGIVFGCKGDAGLLKPTLMTAVPLMLDRIRKAVNEVSGSKGLFAKAFFKHAVKYKQFWHKRGFNTPILNRLVFKKIKDLIGGNVRLMACGGAPLSPDTHEFIRTCLGVKLLQGYGMTETAASATIMASEDSSIGRVGAPLGCCHIRLVDWSEANYFATDKPNPRGEIVIGGDCVSLGYYKNEAQTRESFIEEDGVKWFHTGDIGELFPNGTFKIIDRKKDLVKLQYGEYISLGKVEAELKTCPLVDNICVIGNGFYDFLVALVVPNVLQLNSLATTMSKGDLPLQEICQDPAIIAAVSRAIVDQGHKSKLMKTEIPSKVKLCSEEWTPESGLVTAAFKIRRRQVEQFYQSSIEEMYSVNSNGAFKAT